MPLPGSPYTWITTLWYPPWRTRIVGGVNDTSEPIAASTAAAPPPSRAAVLPRVIRVGGPTAASAGPDRPQLGVLGLVTVLLGAFLPMLDFFIVNVALPTIDRDLSAGPAVLEMVVAGYGLAYAVLLVLGGRLGDMFGRRRLFAAGAAGFAVTSLACGLAPTAGLLVAARVAQGATAALMLPQVLATIQATTSGGRRARALSGYGAVGGLAVVIGQVLGGVLVSADLFGSGWRSIFLVNVPVALVAALLALRSVPESRAPHPAPVDLPGTALLAVSLLTLLVPLMEGRAVGWPLWTWLLLVAFPFAAWAFVRVERRTERAGRVPLVPPSLLAVPGMRRGLVLALPFFVGFGGFMFVVAVALQQGLRFGPETAGLALVPMAVGFFITSLSGPRLVGRYGSRTITAGALLQAAGLVVLALTFRHGWPDLGPLDLLPGTALAGAGQGLVMTPLFRVVLAEVPVERAGVGSGVLVTTQQSGLALGVATLGTLFLSLAPAGSLGMRDAVALVLLLQLAGTAAVVLLSTRLPRVVR
ncbi:MFS transporter [Streptomyces sp. NPDC092296]|uniref:MFS transporter n=1 Tax=Streptomyces sp. NPDC092296 TaxID=3366012 RepID=UPI003814E0D5